MNRSKNTILTNQSVSEKEVKSSEALKGDELLEYVKNNRSQLANDGDTLCIGAGYGASNEDGMTVCRLDLFSTELIKANKASHYTNSINARKEILNCYDLGTLKNIVELGCISGKAHAHLQIADNEKFFDENKDEISSSLKDYFGSDYLSNAAERSGGKNSHWKHRVVWRFIEMVATEEIEKNK